MTITLSMCLVALVPVVAIAVSGGVTATSKRSAVVRKIVRARQEEEKPDWMKACLDGEKPRRDPTPMSIAHACRSGAAQGRWRKAFSATPPAENAKAAREKGAASNFTVSLEDILRATEEQYPWALRRLSEKFQRLVNDPTAHLTIGVLGNSMTAGHGTNKTCGYCDRWSNRLEAYFKQQGFPNVRVQNMGRIGGSTSRFRFDEGLSADEQVADVFLVDYTLSDSPPCCGYKNASEVAHYAENWVRTLLSLPSQPAVVYMETFTASELYGYNCKHSSDEFPHLATLKQFKVPMIDYNAAVCRDKSSDAYWGGGPHPDAAPTHENVGRVAAGYFFRLMERLCSPTENTNFLDHPAEIYKPFKDASMGCAINPVMRMDANGGAKHFPSMARDESSWCFAEDVQGRPGWIAMPGQAAGNVSFRINVLKHFRLKMTYLKTFEKIGSVTCTVGGTSRPKGSESPFKITALDPEAKESYLSAYDFPFTMAPGSYILHCQSDGSKFKIVGLSACAGELPESLKREVRD